MNMKSFFENLAHMTIDQIKSSSILDQLPPEIKNAYLSSNSQDLRELLSKTDRFADARTVTQ